MEVVYLTTVTSGFHRALIAAGMLKELFLENEVRFPEIAELNAFKHPHNAHSASLALALNTTLLLRDLAF